MSQIVQLVRTDQALHGRPFTLVEFWGAFVLAGVLAILSFAHIRAHGAAAPAGVALAGISLNYLPLAIYASQNNAYPRMRREEIEAEDLRRMTRLSMLLVVPFAIAVLSVTEALARRL